MDLAALLDKLLVEWRRTHDQVLEPLIEQIGRELARRRGPGDLDRLLDGEWPRSAAALRKRVDALAAFEPDPRITGALCVVAPRYQAQQHQPFQKAAVALMARAPTAAIPDAIERLKPSVFTSLYGPAMSALRALVRRETDPTLIATATAALPRRANLDELWAQHIAAPGDLGYRAVLADALVAAGDPRGEFINLQLGAGDPKREKELALANLVAWVGAIPYYDKTDVIFERGFPVYVRTPTYVERVVASCDAPGWRTIEQLEFEPHDEGDLTPLLAKTPLLRELSTSTEVIDLLEKSGPHPGIRHLDLSQRKAWPDRAAFPNLELLAGWWDIDSDAAAKNHAKTAAGHGLATIVHTNMEIDRIACVVKHRRFGPPETRLSFDGVYLRPSRWCIRVRKDDTAADMAWNGSRVGHDEDVEGSKAIVALVDAGIEAIRIFVRKPAKFPKLDAAVKKLSKKAAITRDGAPI